MSDILDRPIVHNLTAAAAEYAAAARGVGTQRAYSSQWGQFVQWCKAEGLDPLSGEATVALAITAMAKAGLAVSTIDVRIAAIQHEYRKAEIPFNATDSVLGAVREGIARTVGTAPRRKAQPATAEALRDMLGTRRPATCAQGARDRLLLLMGFGAALRRSELVALRIGDVVEIPGKGLRLTIRRSKADQTGAGAEVHVAANPFDVMFCPVVAWRRWMEHRITGPDMDCDPQERQERPLLCAVNKAGRLLGEQLEGRSVALVIKAAAEECGMDESIFSGHSLRRGMLTSGAECGADLKGLMRHARQKDPRSTLRYIDQADAWINNVSGSVFGASA